MPTITTKELSTLKIAKRYHHTVKSRLAIVHYAFSQQRPKPGGHFLTSHYTVLNISI